MHHRRPGAAPPPQWFAGVVWPVREAGRWWDAAATDGGSAFISSDLVPFYDPRAPPGMERGVVARVDLPLGEGRSRGMCLGDGYVTLQTSQEHALDELYFHIVLDPGGGKAVRGGLGLHVLSCCGECNPIANFNQPPPGEEPQFIFYVASVCLRDAQRLGCAQSAPRPPNELRVPFCFVALVQTRAVTAGSQCFVKYLRRNDDADPRYLVTAHNAKDAEVDEEELLCLAQRQGLDPAVYLLQYGAPMDEDALGEWTEFRRNAGRQPQLQPWGMRSRTRRSGDALGRQGFNVHVPVQKQ